MPSSYTLTGTERKASSGIVAGKGDAHSLKQLLCTTVELTTATAGTTIDFGNIPSNARISGQSRVYCDDCATTGAPILDMGLAAVDANITDDPDALGNGQITLATASINGYAVVSDAANIGLPAWDFVNAQTSDPGGELTVYGTVTDASTTQTGSVTVEIYGYLD